MEKENVNLPPNVKDMNQDQFKEWLVKQDYDLKSAQNIIASLYNRRAEAKAKRKKFYDDAGPQILELSDIVGSKTKYDITRANWATTPESANKYFTEKNKKGWRVQEQDVDGDDVKEILVYDHEGNPRYVNGYGIKKSELEKRQEYYRNHPAADDRMNRSMSEWINDVKLDKDGSLAFVNDIKNRNPKKKPKLKDLFQQYVVTPYLDLSKNIPYVQKIRQEIKPKYRGQLVLAFMRNLWFNLRVDIFTNTFGENSLPNDAERKQISSALNKAEKENTNYFNNLRAGVIAMAEGIGTADPNIETLVFEAWRYSLEEVVQNSLAKGKSLNSIFTNENEEIPSKYGKASRKYATAIKGFKDDSLPGYISEKLQKKLIKQHPLDEDERTLLNAIDQTFADLRQK